MSAVIETVCIDCVAPMSHTDSTQHGTTVIGWFREILLPRLLARSGRLPL